MRDAFQLVERGQFRSQPGFDLLQGCGGCAHARFPVALGLQHFLLQFVFARADFVVDPLQPLFFAGLESLSDPGLSLFKISEQRALGLLERRIGFGKVGRQLPALLLEGHLAALALPVELHPDLFV